MTIFAVAACASLVWLILCLTSNTIPDRNKTWVKVVTCLAAFLLSLYIFGRGVTIGTVTL